MAMLRICAADGCVIKTLGEYCIDHDPPREVAVEASPVDGNRSGLERPTAELRRDGPAGTETGVATVSAGVHGAR